MYPPYGGCFCSRFRTFVQWLTNNERERKQKTKTENKRAYDKRRTNVQRGAAAEGNREMQSDDDGLCDNGDTGATAEDEGQRAVP